MDRSPRNRFSANLRRLRQRRGMSQADLSRASGISASVLSRLESAEREPRLSTVFRIARVLDEDMGELLRGVR
ncbi:MAG: helix-turn-helix transcriptional regulator [Thermoleophilaceae bacterium]